MMWFDLTDDDITAIEFGPKLQQMELARRIRDWQAEQTSADAQRYRSGVEQKERDCEMDEGAVVSASEDGAYVQTWRWVDKDWNDDDDDTADC